MSRIFFSFEKYIVIQSEIESGDSHACCRNRILETVESHISYKHSFAVHVVLNYIENILHV